jgi:hypothetical protein
VKHELYIFGSITRGEVSLTSDVDILVIPLGPQRRESYPDQWSVYSAQVVESYYRLGRLFAWHLHLEAKCLYSPTADNLLSRLGPPAPYTTYREDIDDLESIMNEALSEIRRGTNSLVYELGIVHTAVRDIAMSASWKLLGVPTFSRNSPYLLSLDCPLPQDVYHAAMLARHNSTRGAETPVDADATATALLAAPLTEWVAHIRSKL